MTREQLEAFCRAVAAVCKEHNAQIRGRYGEDLAISHMGEIIEVWSVDSIDAEGYHL